MSQKLGPQKCFKYCLPLQPVSSIVIETGPVSSNSPLACLVSDAVGGGAVEARRAAVLAGRSPADGLMLLEAVGQPGSRQLVDRHEDSGAVALVGQAQWTTGQRRQTAQHVTSERLALA